MEQTKILIHKEFIKGKIDKRIYGSFVEHMGRVVYTGIYESEHPKANKDGFREDVIDKAKEMGVTCVRYPGGNFVSNYDWRDGIGPIESRPRKRDLAWKSIETNEVGTDEFMKWIHEVEAEPIFAVNLGTKGVENAVSLLEYCNLEKGSYYSDLRCENGHEEPYGIKIWCLGNEMDGDWQIGHKTAEEYGRLAHEVGKAMKLLDPSIELVVCGSSMSTNSTFGTWEKKVLEHTYDTADYISLHQYYGGQDKGTPEFLAQSLDMERYIKTVCNICDVEKVKRNSDKELNICFDEWGVWSIAANVVQKSVEDNPWQIAPAISEQIYSMEDALLFSSMMMNFLKYCDRVKVGCQSLLTNISACIMTEKMGDSWVQPIYYPFHYIAKYGQGVVLDSKEYGSYYQTENFKKVPCVDQVVVYNEDKNELVLFMVNRTEIEIEIELNAEHFELDKVVESVALNHEKDIKATNLEDHNCITPIEIENSKVENNMMYCNLLPLSFQMVRINLK